MNACPVVSYASFGEETLESGEMMLLMLNAARAISNNGVMKRPMISSNLPGRSTR